MKKKTIIKKAKAKIKTKTLVNFILDKSGSMYGIKDQTISGFNEYLNTLKKDGNDYRFSLTLFDTAVENRNVNVPIKDIAELNKDTYIPDGMTALYDAVCQTVTKVKKNLKKGIKVMTVIMTDGEENSSQEYTQDQFKKKVQELEKTKMWSFVYLGANQDAWANAQKFGFSKGNVSVFHATGAGVRGTFSMMAQNIAANAGASDFTAMASSGGFFSDEDKKKLEKTK